MEARPNLETPRPAKATFSHTYAFGAFIALIGLQGFHLLEHVAQVVQRYVLGIPNGNGLLGSVADVEPLHFVYNAGYLALLVTTYLLLGFGPDRPHRIHTAAFALLSFTLLFQGFHVVEHVFKMVQYVQLGFQNGTGGILGIGPGSVAPLFPIPLLHLGYNAVAYLPALVAFVLILRRTSTSSGASI